MKTFGKKPDGLRLGRMRASPLWAGDGLGFRNRHPVLPGLRDPAAPRPSLRDFLFGGERRVPTGPLPALDPREVWLKAPDTGLRATWLGHSTVRVEMGCLRVLTDPVWGPTRPCPRPCLGRWIEGRFLAGARLTRPPGNRLRDCPPPPAWRPPAPP